MSFLEEENILTEIYRILAHERNQQVADMLRVQRISQPTEADLNRIQTSATQDLFSEEENWILNEASPLYILEKSSHSVQPNFIRTFPTKTQISIDSIIKNLYEKIYQKHTNLRDTDDRVFRIIYYNKDFTFDTGNNTLSNLESESNDLRLKVVTSLSPQILHFCLILSLNFGGNLGGHFAGVIGTTLPNGDKKIFIFDPYHLYFDNFRQIIVNVFNHPDIPQVWRTVNIENFTDKHVEINMLSYRPSRNQERAPADNFERILIQDARSQDHFCWAWCILFLHSFMISNCDIGTCNQIFRIFTEKTRLELIQCPLVVYIKAYVYLLINNNLINSRLPTLKECLRYIWHSTEEVNFINEANISRERRKRFTPNNFGLYFINDVSQFEINIKDFTLVNLISFINSVGINPILFDNEKILLIKKTPEEYLCRSRNRLEILEAIRRIRNDQTFNPNLTIIELGGILQNTQINPIDALTQLTKDPDSWLEEFLIPQNFNDNKAQLYELDCKGVGANTEAVKLINNTFVLNRYKEGKSRAKLTCETNNQLIRKRNEKNRSVTQGPSCEYSLSEIYGYQRSVIDIMIRKARNPLPSGRLGGLLVWYGTGTGKTLSASLVAKFLSFCNRDEFKDVFSNCYIISPKSAVSNFKNELEKEDIFSDSINTGVTDTAEYYRAGNIKILSHSNFINTYKLPNDMMNGAIDLSTSLLIIDEAHNFINIEGDPTKSNTAFMLNVCSRAKQVLLLTATPMLNDPHDIATILAMLDGNVLPVPKDDFKRLYVGQFPQNSPPSPNLENVCNNDFPINPSDIQPNPPLATLENIRNYFSQKIIYYENPIASDGSGDMPPFRDIRSCVTFPVGSREFRVMETAIDTPRQLERDSNKRDNVPGFGNLQRNEIWRNSDNIKTRRILEIIRLREENPPELFSFDTNSNKLLFEPSNLKYKYIIFSSFTENIDKIKNFLIRNGFNPNEIGEIHGSILGDSVEKRKELKDKFNRGDFRIMLISKAAEEGVDFKRASVVICAEPVYNWSEYVQIRGRAVRTKAHEPPSIDMRDYGGLVARTIESYVIVYSQRTLNNISWDLTVFKAMYTKRFEIERFTQSIRQYFYPIDQTPKERYNIIH